MKKLFVLFFVVFSCLSCTKKPSPLLEQNVIDLKNKGICDRVIGGNPYIWSLNNNIINDVIFEEARVAINRDECVEGIQYKKTQDIRGFVTKSEIQSYQEDFNSLDRYFSNLFNEEAASSENRLNGSNNTLFSWEKDGYKVHLALSIPYEPNKFILFELNIFTDNCNPNVFFFNSF